MMQSCSKFNVECVVSEVWGKGGKGGAALAKAIIEASQAKTNFKYLYDLNASLKEKIEVIASEIYGADGVEFTDGALKDLEHLEQFGLSEVPVCVAKTQITVRELKPSAGAGFVVAYTGAIMTMPGLPLHPAAEKMDITEDGKIKGLF